MQGGLFLLGVVQGARSSRENRSYVGIPFRIFGATYAAAALAEAFIPLFRQSAYPNVHGGPLGRLRVDLDFFEFTFIWPIPLVDLMLFLPVGAYGVAAMVERDWSYRNAVLAVSLAGTVLFAAAEFGHGFLGQLIQLGPLVAHVLGTVLGALAAAVWIPSLTRRFRGRQRPLGLILLHSLVLCLWAWRPFVFDPSLSTIADHLSPQWWIPLASVGSRVDMFSVVDVAAEFLLFFPLGAILAVWPLRHHGPLSTCLPGVYLAALTELGQLIFVGRYLDLTDFLVTAAGVIVGWMVIQRAGYHPYGLVLRASSGP